MSGRWLHRPLAHHRPEGSTGAAVDGSSPLPGLGQISTDSRSLQPGDVFFALRGAQFDGHRFVPDALAAGARMVVVDDAGMAAQPRSAWGDVAHVLQVDDVRRALQRLATAYRRSLSNLTVIGVTGSCGKTTTKQILHAVLGGRLRGRASPKSYNNDVGVPLTLLSARPNDQYLVVEIGTNAPGEIAALSAMAEPDVVIITHVGRSHLEGLGTLADVAREKGSIVNSLHTGGLAVLNGDSWHLRKVLAGHPSAIWFGRAEDADVRLTDVAICSGAQARQRMQDAGADVASFVQAGAIALQSPGTWFETNRRRSWFIPLPGEHQALNAMAAIVVARRLGLTDDEIAAGLVGRVQAVDGRMKIESAGPVTIYDDAYNANPDSMDAALRTIASLTAEDLVGAGPITRVLVLGDMLELGERSEEYHRDLGRAIHRLHVHGTPFRLVFGVGPRMAATCDELRRHGMSEIVEHVEVADDAAVSMLAGALQAGDHVLIKGSRGGRLDRVVAAIRERLAPPGDPRREAPPVPALNPEAPTPTLKRTEGPASVTARTNT